MGEMRLHTKRERDLMTRHSHPLMRRFESKVFVLGKSNKYHKRRERERRKFCPGEPNLHKSSERAVTVKTAVLPFVWLKVRQFRIFSLESARSMISDQM